MKPEVRIVTISKQLSGRWTLPILLHIRTEGDRFSPLQKRLQISPSRLSSNLQSLINEGVLHHIRAEDRHHPLFPEYTLTDKGRFLKEAAHILSASEQQLNVGSLSQKAWNWPILMAIHHHCSRFNEIRGLLHTATPRILSTRLQELKEINIVSKTVVLHPTPASSYTLSQEAAPILRTANEDLLSIID
ncbi:helix-turn-helix domain-containing protein [Geomicrobium sp. JCM 19039]|uniref:winged helix-turn-helix transcriptional regulator n=1 Tax=Geomicrobium sp. JCM 19039 TaxID=1460636 RepID=UPI00045F4421|nr:winged helix-turn-helix transcriptional regulator [Geomicrobium sp. JCM 19039]GAK14382.1 hypothetical protein JCM19039_4297 [Geomicrobium sp. JCM 19039]